jgi:hypothetical protein
MGLVAGGAGEDDGDSVVGGKVAETEELEEIIWECVDGDGWVRWTSGWRLDEGSEK